jgi:rhodanese-related sulfurtransferase
MVAANVLNGDSRIVHADEIPGDAVLLDVREDAEQALGLLPGAVHMPMSCFRQRMDELDRNRPIVVFCQIGLRGYLAERALRQRGFDVRNLCGGVITWQQYQAVTSEPRPGGKPARPPAGHP